MKLLQFSNPFLSQFNKCPDRMFITRKSNKVLGAVIIFNTIEVMNNPSFGQFLIMGLFPDQTMFQCALSIPAIPYFDIPISSFLLATFPAWMCWPTHSQLLTISFPAIRTSDRSMAMKRRTTANTVFRVILHKQLLTRKFGTFRAIAGIARSDNRIVTQFASFHCGIAYHNVLQGASIQFA